MRLHRSLRPLTPVVLALMMDKPRVALALGLTPSPAWLRLVFNAVLRFRAVRASMLPLPTQPSFVPGKTGTSVYPNGYTLDQIGPR